VDALSHLAFGRALVAFTHCRPTGTARTFRTRPLTAALIIGTIAPDADAILMPFGWDRYLVSHERGTHTLLGAIAMAALLATLLRFVIQPLLKRPRTPWRLLWFSAIVGCLSHLLLDGLCGGSLHPLWPLLDARMSLPLVAMADPLLAVPLLLFLIATFIWRRYAFTLALAVTIVMTIVIGAKIVSRQLALRAYDRNVAMPAAAANRTIEASWGSLTQWYVYDRVDSRVRAWSVDASTGHVALYTERATAPSSSPIHTRLLKAADQLDTVRRARALFDFTFPELLPHEDGSVDVLWSDIRFCRLTACDLRFGGRFDTSGRALEQVVLIGTVRQTRKP
jgi:membrane-bound metal-dependent hydrolase YbcI (DUF457 family)